MTIAQLQYLIAVAEHKNFTAAAQKVFVTQPTLSMQVQRLEEELGVVIFTGLRSFAYHSNWRKYCQTGERSC